MRVPAGNSVLPIGATVDEDLASELWSDMPPSTAKVMASHVSKPSKSDASALEVELVGAISPRTRSMTTQAGVLAWSVRRQLGNAHRVSRARISAAKVPGTFSSAARRTWVKS